MRLFHLVVALLTMSWGFAEAQSASPRSHVRQFRLTPYLWGAGLDGTVGLAGRDADVDVSAKDLVQSLDFGIMGSFEARRNRWSLSTDAVYTNLGKDVTFETPFPLPGDESPHLDMSMAIFDGTGGYQITDSFELLAGLRGVATSSSLQLGEARTVAETDGGFVDPFIGGRLRRQLSEKLSVDLRGDVGGFGVGSDFSWFLSAAGGYRLSRLIALGLGYRVWDFDYQSDSELKRLDAALGGVVLGMTFHF